jgi:hypothetical protein
MNRKNFSRLYILIVMAMIQLPAFSQKNDSLAIGSKKFLVETTFGETAGGYISISEHLEDSLLLTDSLINARYRIASFNLALKCNGNVVKYLENKSGNKLTAEMKQEVVKLHSNCTITFDGIKMISRQKDLAGKYQETKLKPLQLKLK